MEKISIIENGIVKDVDVIRYFKLKDINYLVYSLNETDGGYSKIYIAKVTDKIEMINDSEWSDIKDVLKIILKEISEGELRCVEDLDFKELKGFNIVSSKPFKLSIEMTELFSKNKKIFDVEDSAQDDYDYDKQITATTVSTLEPDYKAMYEEEKIKNDNLESQLENYKAIIENIKEIIND